MNSLRRVSALGIPITWDVLRAGRSSTLPGGPRLSIEEVRTFAQQVLGETPHPQATLFDLASAGPADRDDVDRALAELAAKQSQASLVGDRAWRLVAVTDLIASLPKDPVDSLLALTEFWLDWQLPEDMPHTIQGRGNQISPLDYYTAGTLEQVLQDHQAWIDGERGRLASSKGASDSG